MVKFLFSPRSSVPSNILFWLVRHGKTDNPENRCYGWRDVPLCAEGRLQMEELAEHLTNIHLDAVFAGDFSRTAESARVMAAPRGLNVGLVPALREIHFGEIEGLTFQEAEMRFPETTREWVQTPELVRFPGGECFEDVCRRVVPWCHGMLDCPGQSLLCVIHSGTIRALLRWMTGCAPHKTLMVKIGYGDVFGCEFNFEEKRWEQVVQWNSATGACESVIEKLLARD